MALGLCEVIWNKNWVLVESLGLPGLEMAPLLRVEAAATEAWRYLCCKCNYLRSFSAQPYLVFALNDVTCV